MNFGGNQRSRRRSARWVKRGLYLAIGLGTIWFGGLFWFAAQVPSGGNAPTEKTDAIVVLTGGTGRLDMGLRLLEQEKAKNLFVSGVARGVDVATLLRVAQRAPKELECCIAVGYRADDTAGNAIETADWVRNKGFRSIRLVTANYHMPRSLIEFHHAMPNIRIVPHPVYPPRFKRARWWLWPGTAALLASEFNKYMIAFASRNGQAVMRKDHAQ